jgi:hypothetical protein
MPSGKPERPSRDRRAWARLVWPAAAIAIFAVASTTWKGYRFGGSNQAIQVPLVKHLLDPGLYRGDLLLQSFDGYVTYFFRVLAWLAPVAGGLEPLYYVLYISAHALTLAALCALAWHLFRSTPAAVLACLMHVAQVPSLGAEFTYWPRLTHGHVATALLLWSVYLYLRGRTVASLLLCGLTVNIHALYAAHVAALLGFDIVLSRRTRRSAAALAVFLLAALPSLWWLWRSGVSLPPQAGEAWTEILRERSGLHAFPFSVPAAVYGRYALLVATFALALQARPEPRTHRRIVNLLGGGVLLVVAGVVFAEIWPVVSVMKAQLLRSTKWPTFLMLIYIARWLAAAGTASGPSWLTAVLVFLGLWFQQAPFLAAALAAHLVQRGSRTPPLGAVTAAVALAVGAWSGAVVFPERLGLQQMTSGLRDVLADPLVITPLALLVVLRTAWDRLPLARALAATAAGLVLVFAWILPLSYREAMAASLGEPWSEVQTWAREHTPREATILTPPYREGFRVFSERAIVGEWKDGTQQFFARPEFVFAWQERMRDLGGETRSFDGFSTERVVEAARKYGARYVVFAAERPLSLAKLYENAEFAVYSVPIE